MAAKSPAMLLKVVILGNGGVGKSSLMNRFINNQFDALPFHTIGVEFLNKDIVIGSEVYVMQIWDTAGQERFKSLRTPFYRGSDCCVLTFDVNDRSSFENIPYWRKEFIHYADIRDPESFPFVLIGNKVDVGRRQVEATEAEAWCRENGGIPYFETSAKDNTNVELAFRTVATQIKARQPQLKPEFSGTIDLKDKKSDSSCC